MYGNCLLGSDRVSSSWPTRLSNSKVGRQVTFPDTSWGFFSCLRRKWCSNNLCLKLHDLTFPKCLREIQDFSPWLVMIGLLFNFYYGFWFLVICCSFKPSTLAYQQASKIEREERNFNTLGQVSMARVSIVWILTSSGRRHLNIIILIEYRNLSCVNTKLSILLLVKII